MKDLRTEKFLNAHTVASRLGCSTSTIWRRSADGTLPQPIKFGHATRWLLSEIEDFIETVKATRNAGGQ